MALNEDSNSVYVSFFSFLKHKMVENEAVKCMHKFEGVINLYFL